MEQDLYQLTEDYLLNRLSEEDRKQFEQALETDPALQEALELERELVEATSEKEVLQLRKQLRAQFRDTSTSAPARPWLLALAVVILIALLTYWWWPRPQPAPETPSVPEEQAPLSPDQEEVQGEELLDLEQTDTPIAEEQPPSEEPVTPPESIDTDSEPRYLAIAETAYANQPYSVTLRGQSDEQETSLIRSAELAYQEENYEEVLRLLQEVPEGFRSEALKLIAHSEFNLANFEKAAGSFEGLKSGFYRYDADWYQFLSLTALLPAKQDEWEDLRDEILSGESHPFKKKVETLLDKM